METNEACVSWTSTLGPEKEKPYFKEILQFLDREKQNHKTIYPAKNDIFNALKYTSFEDVKVVIIGQDPYHGPNQAHGLCFSVEEGVIAPPSLKNIFKELHNDLGIVIPNHGCLKKWAEQGVLLLNAVLTVEAGKPQSHAQKGWETFTDKIIAVINEKKEGIVFLLWGSYAQQKGLIIDPTRHFILKAAHPSPLSVKGFLGCRHFSKTNEILKKQAKTPIDWSL